MEEWGERRCGRVESMPPLPMRREEKGSTGVVGTWERTDNPPHPPPLSNNCPQLTQQTLKRLGETRKMENQNKVATHGFFSLMTQGLTSPTPYPLESCPFHSTLHCHRCLWFILFDVRVYMMSNYKVPNSTTYHRQLSLLPKHTQPNRWWDFFL